MRNRWLVLAAALAASLSALLVALGTQVPASAASGTPQAGKLPVGNLLSYDNSDFEGHANFIPVTNIAANGITDSAAFKLHGKDALKFTATAAGTTVLKLQEGSSATQINVNGGKTYTLGGWFKLPATNNSGESITFGLGLYDSGGNWLGWSNTSALSLSATSNWQYVEGSVQAQFNGMNAAWALDSPQVTLSNAAMGQVTYMDMLVFEPRRAAQAIGAHGNCGSPTMSCNYSASNWTSTNTTIGPLQSDKEFISGDLPSDFSQTVCHAIENSPGMSQSNWPVCVIAYTGTLSTNDTTAQIDMNNFLANVPAGQELYIVWQSEPEGKDFTSTGPQPGCPSGQTNAQAFVCEFDRQAGFVHNSSNFGPNIFVAMNSGGSHYGDVTDDNSAGDETKSDGTQDPNTLASCPWMPPNSANGGADIYLVDFYQYSFVEGTDVNTEALREDNWKNWLSCATGNNRPIGFGEYGLDETAPSPPPQPPTCTNNTNDAANAPNAMSADNVYLKNLPMSGQAELQNRVPVAMWAYWYSNYGGTADCTVFTSSTAISTWQGIETANGGG
jgi:hypothetical protein